uniref:ADAMTS-like protein 1 n=3 Tax=Cacopsylla melanoneura TaxID=428564 RepID=A0A8D8V293_9HEMI
MAIKMNERMLFFYLLIWIVKVSSFKLESYDYTSEDSASGAAPGDPNMSSSNYDLGAEAWSDWSDWADCSRSCDGGVTYQVRRCNSVSGCTGEKIRYQICNMQPCSEPVDFRAEQCSQYNGQLYNGQAVIWAPHIEPENPCSLTCITQNGDIVTLNSRVQDGTRCSSNSLDTCINGICQKVGCDLRIGSSLTVDTCGVCGGDDSTCQGVRIDEDYYYWSSVQDSTCSRQCGGGIRRTHVNCRNRVTEEIVKPDLCKVETKPRVLETECNTQPCAAKWIAETWGHCSVPCGKGIRSRKYYCVQDIDGVQTRVPHHHCPKHNRPKPQEPCFVQACPPKWVSQKWSPCSAKCGEGIQTRNVSCNEGRPESECVHLEKPPDVRTCSSEVQCDWNEKTLELEYRFRNYSTAEKLVGKLSPSEPTWTADEWGDCSSPCGPGVRRRHVLCKIFLEFSKTFATLPDSECAGPKPVIEEKCIIEPCAIKNRWVAEPWSNCSVPCGEGIKVRSVLCKTYLENARVMATVPDNECEGAKPVDKQRCVMTPCILEHKLETAAFQDEEVKVVSGSKGSFTYSWRSDDYTQCSQSCLQGIQENIVMCIRDQDSRSVHPGLCDPKTRPEVITRTCNDFSCPPRWQTGDFQPCSKTCGLGIQLREVVCIHEVVRNSTSVVPNIQCPQPPPPDRQYCAVIDCPIQWHTDKWSKCSRACGGGVKTRKVECKQEMAQRHIVNRLPTQCPKHRPVDKRPCNTKPCATEISRPFIATDNSTFIQQDPDQVKVHLKVGLHATVYYNTQLKIKCPVHQFDRSKIKWTKDGQVIRRGKNYKISKKGALKIVRATFQDNGVFTCRAGQSGADITIVVKPKTGVFINSEELPHGDGSKIDPSHYEPGKSPLRYDPEDSHETNPTGARKSTQAPATEWRKRKPSKQNPTFPPVVPSSGEDQLANHSRENSTTTDTTEQARSGSARLVPNFHSLLSHLQNLVWPFQSYTGVRGHTSRLTNERPAEIDESREALGLRPWDAQNGAGDHSGARDHSVSTDDGSLVHNGEEVPKQNGGDNGEDVHHSRQDMSRSARAGFPLALAQTDEVFDAYDEEEEMGEEFIMGKGSRESLKFEWAVTEWSKCSKPCGGNGFRMRAAHCMAVLHNRTRHVDPALCADAGLDPVGTIGPCGSRYCPVWKTGMWATCGETHCWVSSM